MIMVMVVFGRGAGHRNRVDLLRNASAGRRVASPTCNRDETVVYGVCLGFALGSMEDGGKGKCLSGGKGYPGPLGYS